jgi:hypothetical protein
MLDTPVVLLVFNRPEETRRVLEQIRRVQPRHLLVVADGPRANRPDDATRCAEVRQVITEGVDWPCTMSAACADENLGCARRVSSGLDWVFLHAESAIILEDDCVPDESFFPYAAELLERYRDHPRIAQIAGCSFQPAGAPHRASYFFSRYPHCWGWATWRDRWRWYDHAMSGWKETRGAEWLPEAVEHKGERRRWAAQFDAVVEGRIDSWAYRWTAAMWRRGALSITPSENLVTNIGFGPTATHTRTAAPGAAVPLARTTFPLVHPTTVARDAAADDYTSRLLFRPPTKLAKARHRVAQFFAR